MANKLNIPEYIKKIQEAPANFTRRIYLGTLRAKCINAINADIKLIVDKNLACDDWQADFIDVLKQLIEIITPFTDGYFRKPLLKSLRLLILISKNHLLSQLTGLSKSTVTNNLQYFTQSIGEVPKLNPTVVLPAPPQLPQKMMKQKKNLLLVEKTN